MSAQLGVFVSVWESVQLRIHLAGICLATDLGEGRTNILLVFLAGGGLSGCLSVCLWLEIHPSRLSRGMAICLSRLRVHLSVCPSEDLFTCLIPAYMALSCLVWTCQNGGGVGLSVASAEEGRLRY